jgi:uncharacterized protein (TIGR02996 family)
MQEEDFLRAVCADPKDDALLKVYSDWLEEQGDAASAAKAEFLRLTAAPAEEATKAARDARLHKLAVDLDTNWLAVVSRMQIENCAKKRAVEQTFTARFSGFRFLCERKWEDLRTTDHGAERFCDDCQQGVHYCDTITEARQHARRGHCVAVDLGVIRRDGDLRERLLVMGLMSPEAARREEELERPDPVSAMRERRKQKEAREAAHQEGRPKAKKRRKRRRSSDG